MAKRCIGVDIGGTSVKLGIFDTEGTLIEKWEIETRKTSGGRDILKDIAETIKAHLQDLNLKADELAGIGLGVPGPVMPNGFVEVCVNLGWRNINPQEELRALIGADILIRSNNDANVAALGEMWQGGGKGYRDLVMITLGTGVGGGIILNQRILGGNHGMAGEIGHIHVRDEEQEICNCGGRGCLEQIASATGIVREAVRRMTNTDIPSPLRSKDKVTAKDVLDLAKAGDPLCEEVMETVGRYLGLITAQLSMVVDPEAFVFGGGVSKAGVYLLDITEKYLNQYCSISSKKADLRLAQLGNDAGIYGSARLILD